MLAALPTMTNTTTMMMMMVVLVMMEVRPLPDHHLGQRLMSMFKFTLLE
jgi:hypothetical protein